MRFTANPSDLDTVKNAAALHCRSLFGAKALADNIGVGPAALEKWLYGHAQLSPSAMIDLVKLLFHGKVAWNPETGTWVDVVKPSSTMMDGRDIPHGQTSASPP